MALILRPPARPVLPIDDGNRVSWDQPGDELASAVEAGGSVIEGAVAATGRIELDDHPSVQWSGAGFLAGPGLVITSGNIADLLVPSGPGGIVRHRPVLRMGALPGEGPEYRIVGCLLRHPVLNFAVLELDRVPAESPLILDATAEISTGDEVAIASYYAHDERNDPVWLKDIGSFEAGQKVVSPGRVLGLSVDRFSERGNWSLTHDCSTLGGAGGAAVVGLRSGMVHGCHFAGKFGVENYAVPISEIALDPRIRALGLRFAGLLPSPDPLAFGAEYPDSSFTSPGDDIGAVQSHAKTYTPGLDAAGVKSLTRQLLARYPNVDAALDFLRAHGPAYAEAIEAQPGRGRVSDDEYVGAVADSLNRRGLLDAQLVDAILPSDVPASDALSEARIPPAVAGLALSDETLESVAAVLPKDGEKYVMGSPFAHSLSRSDGTIEPLPDLVRRLARDGSADASEALGWLLRSIAAWGDLVDTAPISAALGELGQPLPDAPQNLPEPDALEMVDISFLSSGLAAARSVARVRFARSGSSGWLIAPDLVVAPAHVTMFGERHTEAKKLLTPEEVDLSGCVVEFDADQREDAVVAVAAAEVALLDHTIDLMILRLAESMDDRDPLQIELGRPAKGPVAAIHHPNLGPKVLSYVGGQIFSNDGHDVRYVLATSQGSAGAPVLNQDWKVVATHRAATRTTDASGRKLATKLGMSVEALVVALRGAAEAEQLWRRICGAQEALRTIDPVLLSADHSGPRPALLVLVDGTTELPVIAGMSVISRQDHILSVLVDSYAARQLAGTPGVVSLSASGTALQTESRVSLPFVGVPLDRAGIDELGEHALIALIDDGIDPYHHAFRDGDGNSRIDLYWDQRDTAVPADALARTFSQAGTDLVERLGVKGGAVYLGTDFDALADGDRAALRAGLGHGTAVASIAAGRALGDQPKFGGGIAPDARLIVVRFDRGGQSIGASAGHLNAIQLIEDRAEELGLPVVVNISNGMNAGAHDGSAEVERRCAKFVDRPNHVIVKSAGNEGGLGRHARFEMIDQNMKSLRWDSRLSAQAREGASDELELWFGTHNLYNFEIVDPDKNHSGVFPVGMPISEGLSNLNYLDASYEQYATANPGKARLSITVSPGKKKDVQPGEWKLVITVKSFRARDLFHAWLEERSDRSVSFKADSYEECTITIPGTGKEVITVGAITPRNGKELYNRSSRGPNADGVMKPDLVAPGVHIAAARAGTDEGTVTDPQDGTSLAAPHVTGAVALALSMGHKAAIEGRHPAGFSYREIRQLLIDHAQDFNVNGSAERGYGSLDVRAFLDAVRARLGLV
ncbi:S8 family serine peptidase [Microbacterium sp. DT81.1]|uniref:S8 family serine peptidase n=1 Tax=Microbacterium sp. DT81.1 TaxID=3393413 RepID=UPI003CF70C21